MSRGFVSAAFCAVLSACGWLAPIAGASGCGLVIGLSDHELFPPDAGADAHRDSGSGGSGGSSGSGSGSDGGPTEVTISCTTGMLCQQWLVSSEDGGQTMFDQSCSGKDGGTLGTGCSTSGLAGCCTYVTVTECFYDPATAMAFMPSCIAPGGGTWSSTP